MEAWLFTDDHGLALRVHAILAKLRVACPESRVVNIASLEPAVPRLRECGDVFLFAVRQIHESHVDLIKQIRAAFDGTLVIVASMPSQTTLLKTIRAGADDFLDADGALESELAELISHSEIRRLRANLKCQLLAVVPCQSPGDGNLLAVNLAAILAKHVGGCVLLDFHMRGGDLALMLKLAPRHTFLELVRQQRNIDRSMLDQALTQHESGIRLLAGPEMFIDMEDTHLHVARQVLEIAKTISPNVVVGFDDVRHAEQVQALAVSDAVLLVTRTDLVSLYRAKRHVDFLLQHAVPPERICVVTIASEQEGELPLTAFKKLIHVARICCITEDPRAAMVSTNLGNPLVIESPKSKHTRGILDLVEALGAIRNGATSATPSSGSLLRATAAMALGTLSPG